MWERRSNIRKMKALDELHNDYLSRARPLGPIYFGDNLSEEEQREEEERLTGIFTKKYANDELFSDIVDASRSRSELYMDQSHQTNHLVKGEQPRILSALCEWQFKASIEENEKEAPFLIFLEEMKCWVVNLPQINDANYYQIMRLIDFKIDYVQDVLDQQVFENRQKYPHREWLKNLVGYIVEFKETLFQSNKDQNILQSLEDLQEVIFPLNKPFKILLSFILRRKLPDWAKGREIRDIYSDFMEDDFIKFGSEYFYTSEVLLPITNIEQEIDRDLFLGKIYECANDSREIISSKERRDEEFGSIIDSFFHLHLVFRDFLKVYRAIQLVNKCALNEGSLVFYSAIKKLLQRIFLKLNETSETAKFCINHLYEQLREFEGEEKTNERCINLAVSKHAYQAIEEIIDHFINAQFSVIEKIANYPPCSHDVESEKHREALIELNDLYREFGGSEGFYENSSYLDRNTQMGGHPDLFLAGPPDDEEALCLMSENARKRFEDFLNNNMTGPL
jgi:hypothetical protein